MADLLPLPYFYRWMSSIRLTLACVLSLSILLAAAVAVAEDDPEFDELMEGFDDGFGDSDEVEQLETPTRKWLRALPFGPWIDQNVDVSGSIAAGAVYSYLDHKVPHGDEPGRSTFYGNLTRLDLDGFLQIDVQLPHEWKIRAETIAWYDFVYRLKGRGNYGGEVIDVYEWQVDSGEVYLTGPLHKKVDLTLGRKVVNWGRSDTLRVVDAINPLDNKEPGLVDIEDLRRPKAMAKLDLNSGPWSAQFMVIPEHRYSRNAPPGSDFFIDLPGLPSSRPIRDRSDFSGMPGLAVKLDGRFSGWDFSLYGAYVDQPDRVLDLEQSGLRAEANRFGLLAAAGNWTRGPWLLKFETAWLTKVRDFRVRNGEPMPSSDDKDQIDVMLGVEFYGRDNLMIAFEVASRDLLNEPNGQNVLQLTPQSRLETALRISRPFFQERLRLTALAVGFGERLQNGGILRLSGDYSLTDAWKAEAGILVFIGGPDPGLGTFESNDRLYAEIKYSF